MKFTPKILRAINQACLLHQGQRRKAGGLPYIVHPFSVALILSGYTKNEDIVVAGLLHDVLEDVSGSHRRMLKKEFGSKVYLLIKEVSEKKRPDTSRYKQITSWQKRKERQLNKMKKISRGALLISTADKIHNLLSLLEVYQLHGSQIWQNFNASPEKQIWHYETAIKLIKQRLRNPIVRELEATYAKVKRIIFKV